MCFLSTLYAVVVLYACMCAPIYSGHQDNAAETSSLWVNRMHTLSEAGEFTNGTTSDFLKQAQLRMKRVPISNANRAFYNEMNDNVFREFAIMLFHRCADAHFCKVAPNWTMSNAHFWCCIVCTCDRNCARTGTCCPDIQTVHDTKYEDVVQTDKDVVCKAIQFDRPEHTYRFVVSCPANADLEARERCAHPGTLGVDMVHVFDTIGQLNYQNRFCAACNGVPNERLVWWTSIIRYSPQNASTAEQRKTSADDELEMGDLEMEQHPPEVEGVNLTICYRDVIDTCNITGNWSHYDDTVYDGCNYLQLFYRHRDGTRIRYFKNIFCAICNGLETLVQQCPDTNAKFTFNTNVGFQFLVSHTLADTEAVVDKRVCGKRYEFDPLSDGCRRFYCAFPTLADDAETKCQDIAYITQSLYSIPVLVQFGEFIDASQAEVIRNAAWDHVMWMAPGGVYIEQMEMYFETEMSFVDLRRRIVENGIDMTDIKVKELVINCIVQEGVAGRETQGPYNNYHEFKEKIHATEFELFLSIKHTTTTTVRLRHLNIDAWNLFPPNSNYSIRLANTDDGSIQYIHENFYSENAMLGLIVSKLPENFMPTVDDVPYAYSKNFLGCPSFVYELENHSFMRTPLGLMINNSDSLVFNFNEFTSINKTHAQICVESVQQKIPVSSGNIVAMVITHTMMLIASLVLIEAIMRP